MSYPQQPYQGQQAQQQGYQSQPGYAGQPSYGAPAYPPQQPAYQPPPQQYQPPPQQYAPPPQQYQVPPGYGMLPPGPPPPQQEQVRGTLQGFMDQPSSGNNSLTFMALGTRYVGTVIRSVTDADIQPQTDMITGAVGTYSDGRVKLVMKIPLMVQPSAQFPDGTATWYVKGHDRDELTRAMEAAGVETDPATGRLFPPRAGDVIDVTYVSDRPGKRGMNPTKVKRVQYTKGNGIAPQVPQQVQQAQPVQPAYNPQWNPEVHYQPTQGTSYAPPAQQYTVTNVMPGTYGQPPAPQMPVPSMMPDPQQAYQQATGQPMPPQGQQFHQPFPTQQQAYQQAPAQPMPAPGPAAPTAQPGYTNGAAPTGPAFPSNEPPPDWPPGVPFIPGLTPQQAAVAATMHHPAASVQ